MTITDFTPLGQVRDWLRNKATEGADCPCCGQFTKVYRTRLPACAARLCIWMYRWYGTDWANVPKFGEQGGDPLKARHWGLIEPMPEVVRDDGSRRTGMWRLTTLGRQFVLMQASVPSHAKLYNSRCLGLDGDSVLIEACVGRKFNYRELMAGV